MGIQRIVNIAIIATVVPAIAFAGGWDSGPLRWSTPDLEWAQNLHSNPEPLAIIEDKNAPPPQAAWCDSTNSYTPNASECDDYDQDLTDWVAQFTGSAQPTNFDSPPSYCGC
jgi:hypothetical protein